MKNNNIEHTITRAVNAGSQSIIDLLVELRNYEEHEDRWQLQNPEDSIKDVKR